MPRTKEYADQTYQESRGKRHRVSGKYAATVQQAKRRRISSTASDTSSGDLDGEDASGEESESEDVEEPAVLAPSRKTFVDGTGRFTPAHDFETASLAGSVDSMFGGYNGLYDQFEDPDLSPDENLKRFESNVFAPSDDDDDAYRAVDEISDSDDDDAEQYEEQQLMSALTDDDDDDILDEEFYLGQIEGLSAYGFGDESDASAQFPPSSHGSDAGVPTEHVPERHVRFDMESHFQPLSSSPTISRALLPSALPDKGKVFGGPASAAIEPFDESTTEDEYDCTYLRLYFADFANEAQPMLLTTTCPRKLFRQTLHHRSKTLSLFLHHHLPLLRRLKSLFNAKVHREASSLTKVIRPLVFSIQAERSC